MISIDARQDAHQVKPAQPYRYVGTAASRVNIPGAASTSVSVHEISLIDVDALPTTDVIVAMAGTQSSATSKPD